MQRWHQQGKRLPQEPKARRDYELLVSNFLWKATSRFPEPAVRIEDLENPIPLRPTLLSGMFRLRNFYKTVPSVSRVWKTQNFWLFLERSGVCNSGKLISDMCQDFVSRNFSTEFNDNEWLLRLTFYEWVRTNFVIMQIADSSSFANIFFSSMKDINEIFELRGRTLLGHHKRTFTRHAKLHMRHCFYRIIRRNCQWKLIRELLARKKSPVLQSQRDERTLEMLLNRERKHKVLTWNRGCWRIRWEVRGTVKHNGLESAGIFIVSLYLTSLWHMAGPGTECRVKKIIIYLSRWVGCSGTGCRKVIMGLSSHSPGATMSDRTEELTTFNHSIESGRVEKIFVHIRLLSSSKISFVSWGIGQEKCLQVTAQPGLINFFSYYYYTG